MFEFYIVFVLLGLLLIWYAESVSADCFGIQCLNGGTVQIKEGNCYCGCLAKFSGIYCEYELQNSTWPRGTYAIPMTKEGCPEPRSRGWEKGYVNFTSTVPLSTVAFNNTDFSNISNTAPIWLQEFNVLGPFGKYTIQLNFCYKTNQQLSSTDNVWPEGTYSIYGTNDGCPLEFENYTITIALPSLLNFNSDGYLPYIRVENRENAALLELLLCRRQTQASDGRLTPSWNSTFTFMKNNGDSCVQMQGYDVTEGNIRILLSPKKRINATTNPSTETLDYIGFCSYQPSNMSYGRFKTVQYFDKNLTGGCMAIHGVRAILSEKYKNDLKDFSLNTGLHELRTKAHFSCYNWTENDRQLIDGSTNISEAEVCESYPYHIWTDGDNEEYPDCGTCACCQVPGCYIGATRTYDGTWDRTITGRTCQRWDKNFPHVGHKIPDYFPSDENISDAHNYCRDPQPVDYSSGNLWCYTVDKTVRFELCNIPECANTVLTECYRWTESDKQLITAGLTASEVCERYSNNIWTRGENVKYPQCGTCLCCKTRGCYKETSRAYNGTWSKTVYGRRCQRWDSETPHNHTYNTSAMFPYDENVSEAHNYCRDPSGRGKYKYYRDPSGSGKHKYCKNASGRLYVTNRTTLIRVLWCFIVSDYVSTSWEICDIQRCNTGKDQVDCYNLSDDDLQVINQDVSSSKRQICEKYPNHFWTNGANDEHLECGTCSCCQIKDCYVGTPYTYTGTWGQTISGLTCQRWDSQYPWKHNNYAESQFTLDGGTRNAHNYCRDPDKSGIRFLWCYTTSVEKNYESCGIPQCRQEIPIVLNMNNDMEDVPWILFDLGSSISVSALKTSLKLSYTYTSNTIPDMPEVYVSNEKWSFLHHGAETVHYDAYFLLTKLDMEYVYRFVMANEGRYLSLLGNKYKANVNVLVYILRLRSVVIYACNHDIETAKPKTCHKNVGMTDRAIEDFQITASSYQREYPPEMARLQHSGWCADKNDVKPYLQIDLLIHTMVEGIVVANWGRVLDGSSSGNTFIKTFVLMGCRSFHVLYGTSLAYLNSYKEQEFQMDLSLSYSEPQTFLFMKPFLARYVHLEPETLTLQQFPCMTIELIGCRKSGFPSLKCEHDATTQIFETIRSFVSPSKPAALTRVYSSHGCRDACVNMTDQCSTNVFLDDDNVCNIYSPSSTHNYRQLNSYIGRTNMSTNICWKDAAEIHPLLMNHKQVMFSESAVINITEETVIVSFGYPFHYDVNQVIKWSIIFTDGHYIKLMFSNISLNTYKNLEGVSSSQLLGAECVELIILSKSETTVPILIDIDNGDRGEYYMDYRYNGYTPIIGTDVSQQYIIFNTCPLGSDLENIGNGFRVIVKNDDIPTCSELSNKKSPLCEHPSMYIASRSLSGIPNVQITNEYWTIGGDITSLRIIILKLTYFDVHCSSGSRFEIGQIGPLWQTSIQTYCNTNRPVEAIYSKYDRLTIRFYYNTVYDMVSVEGFKASYTTVPKKNALSLNENDCSVELQKCYKTYRRSTTWAAASEICSKQNSTLVTIHSGFENEFIRLLMENMTRFEDSEVFYSTRVDPYMYVYIGLFRYIDEDGNVREQWEDDSPLTYTAWKHEDCKGSQISQEEAQFENLKTVSETYGIKEEVFLLCHLITDGRDDLQPLNAFKKQCTRMGYHLLNKENTWESVDCLSSTGGNGASRFICETPLVETYTDHHIGSVRKIWNMTGSEHSISSKELSSMYHCLSGEWITVLSRCDGVPVCIDASDEQGCMDKESVGHDLCLGTMYKCKNGECIQTSEVCNYKQDCSDGSDEFCEFPKCEPSQFTCDNQQCINRDARCDAVDDCSDRSDEIGCMSCNSLKAVQCNDRTCIPSSRVCDSHVDCPDAKDELFCGRTQYTTCADWWQSGFRENGLYEIEGQKVECNFDTLPNDVIKTIIHNINIKTSFKDIDGTNSRIAFISFNRTLINALTEPGGSECNQKIYQTCKSGLLEVALYDGINERSYSSCICILHHVHMNPDKYNTETMYCSGKNDNLPSLASQSKFTFSKYMYPIISFAEENDDNIILNVGPIECTQEYHIAESTMVCKKEHKVIATSKRCLYDKDASGIIDGCRSLEHLQSCEKFQCPSDYVKCPRSFCIASRFVCDGENQCAGGEDEANCWCEHNSNDITIVYNAASHKDVQHNARLLARQLFSSGHVRLLAFSPNTTKYNIPSNLSSTALIITETVIESLQEYLVTRNNQYANLKINNTYTVMADTFVRSISNCATKVTVNGGIIYLDDDSIDTNLADAILSPRPNLEKCSLYKVTLDKTIGKQVMTKRISDMTELRIRHWAILGSIGSTLFPDICRELEEVTCPNMYRCSGSRVCIPLHQVCDGESQCLYRDDEHLCNFHCPERCSCRGYSVDCRSTGFHEADFQNISFVTRKLDASNNTDIAKHDFYIPVELSFLITLNVSFCDIQQISRRTFASLRNLLILDMSYNKIKNIPTHAFGELNHLEQLLLTGNHELQSIEPGAFYGLFTMKHLSITYTKLKQIARMSFSALNLTTLDLSHNQIEGIEGFAFESLTVTFLNLENNNIQNFSKDLFSGVRLLQKINSSAYKFCCIRPASVSEEECFPQKDEFSSCADLMRNSILQTILWVIGVLALVGNFLALFYRLKYDRQRLKLGYGIFVTNLAVADFLMGVYLITIAVADQVYRERYIWMDEYWRNSGWCKMAGVLSTVSSEASVLFVCLITVDRILVIKFPYGQLRFNQKKAVLFSILTWVIVWAVAVIPIVYTQYFQNKFYSKTGVCLALPLTRDRLPGWQYSIAIFIILNFLTFLLLAFGQFLIYMEIRKVRNKVKRAHSSRRNDLTVARNILLVVTTDFMCWFPIGCMGMMAMQGHVISGDVYAWAAVLILPVNSALNPFLYTLPALLGKKKFMPNPDEQTNITDITQDLKSFIRAMDLFTDEPVDDCYDIFTLKEIAEVKELTVDDVAALFKQLIKGVHLLHKMDLAVHNLSENNVVAHFHRDKKLFGNISVRGKPVVCMTVIGKAQNILEFGYLLKKELNNLE